MNGYKYIYSLKNDSNKMLLPPSQIISHYKILESQSISSFTNLYDNIITFMIQTKYHKCESEHPYVTTIVQLYIAGDLS